MNNFSNDVIKSERSSLDEENKDAFKEKEKSQKAKPEVQDEEDAEQYDPIQKVIVQYVKKRPLVSAGGALLAGLLIARLF